MNDFDFELAARLNLYEKLFVQVLGAGYAEAPEGGAGLQQFRQGCIDFLKTVRFPVVLTDDQREEWDLQCSMVTNNLFDRVEAQRVRILRPPIEPRGQ